MNELFAQGDLIGGFRGETRGTFVTPKQLRALDFHGAGTQLSIQKNRTALTGFLQLNVASKGFTVNLFFTPFSEQRVLGGALTSGTLLVSGQIIK